MSSVMKLSLSPKIADAVAFAVSVFPTPVGPAKRSDAGLFVGAMSVSRSTKTSQMERMASSCPMMRSRSVFSIVRIRACESSRPAREMWVMSETQSRMSTAVTVSRPFITLLLHVLSRTSNALSGSRRAVMYRALVRTASTIASGSIRRP